VLAAVAQFEHAIITERVRDGVRRARKRGVQFGRPRTSGPSGAEVTGLRREGRSWSEIAKALNCTVGLARLRAAEFQET
jgi:DNA invertase Pin-like site-specific DNA recombinase